MVLSTIGGTSTIEGVGSESQASAVNGLRWVWLVSYLLFCFDYSGRSVVKSRVVKDDFG